MKCSVSELESGMTCDHWITELTKRFSVCLISALWPLAWYEDVACKTVVSDSCKEPIKC